ncbi:MAG TPA: hypothetical protein VFW31_11370, partial [Candidatus Angelobacter sp.]|nr:hypothetical protein [Candidatus Angelobacter sp.]
MALKSLVQWLWVAGIACQAILGIVLLCKKTWKVFPLFVSYFAIGFAGTVFLYCLQTHRELFFYSYWLLEATIVALGFAVVYEVFSNVFSTHQGLSRLASLIFRTVLGLLLCVGLMVLLKHTPFSFKGITSAVVIVEESARIIEVGLLVCLFIMSSAFGLHWRQQVFGVALGLGLYAAVELASVAIWGQTSKAVHEYLNVVRILGFNTSLVIWIGYLLAPERTVGKVELPQRTQLEQWNQAVM